MSIVILFRSSKAALASQATRSGAVCKVIKLSERKATTNSRTPGAQRKQVVDPCGEIRELVWVSPLENGLIQALFRGLDAAAAYLRQQATMPPSTYTYRAGDFDDGWRILWTSGAEVDLFNYVKTQGLLAAADLLSEQARKR